MRRAAFLTVFLLSACASVADYKPYVVDIVQPAVLTSDEADCLAYAQAYASPLTVSAVGTGAAQGAANNAAYGAINPLVPVLGAAGGATASVLSGIGILNNDKRRAFLICLSHRGERSRAYDVIDPNQ